MFKFAIKKLFKNKWLSSCLLIGCTIAVAILSSIPVYRDAVMQRMLEKDLERVYNESGVYPGVVKVRAGVKNAGDTIGAEIKTYNTYKENLNAILKDTVSAPIVSRYERITYYPLKAYRAPQYNKDSGTYVGIAGQNTIDKHINIIAGRMYSDKITEDGYIEVIANQTVLFNTELVMGVDYVVKKEANSKTELKIRIVGVYETKKEDSGYWQRDEDELDNMLMGSFSLLSGEVAKSHESLISGFTIANNYDYKQMRIKDVDKMIEGFSEIKQQFLWLGNVSIPAHEIMLSYPEREQQLFLTLTVLQLPLVLILVLYIFMVSKLTVEHDANEISVLKSRGSTKWQILKIYLVESVLFGAVSFVLGIPIGFFICRILGFSNGFLEFVSRKAMLLQFSWQILIFAAAAILIFVVTMLAPAFFAAKTEIVEFKRSKGSRGKKAVWEKFYIDVLLLVLSLYGLFNYFNRQSAIISMGESAEAIPMDPFLFLMSSAFIVGSGLVFLRLYPYLMKAIFKIGEKSWSPTLYASFVNTSRSDGKDRFIMLFLIFSLSIGIFNATAARTLSYNEEEKAGYKVGADMTVSFEWITGSDAYGQKVTIEADTDSLDSVKGINSVTKVINQQNNVVAGRKSLSERNVPLMGIVPDDFQKIAWWRDDILPYDLDHYLDLLKKDTSAVILSTSLKEKLAVSEGNTINIQILGGERISCRVAAFVDYWPTYYSTDPDGKQKDLIVINYDYLQSPLSPLYYSLWVDTDEDVSREEIYKGIAETGLKVISINDRRGEIIEAKSDALLQGVNGTLTMGFCLTLIISAIGFIIFWILSVKGRSLQFGILRSMGMTKRKITVILFWDQMFVSGISVLIGLLVGFLTAKLYIPVLQISASAADQVPSLLIISQQSDYVRVALAVVVMIIAGIAVLSGVVGRMNINQTLKLGED